MTLSEETVDDAEENSDGGADGRNDPGSPTVGAILALGVAALGVLVVGPVRRIR